MKRSALARRTGLRRSTLPRTATLRSHARPSTPTDAERAWKTPRWGRCENCGQIDVVPLHGHHVLARPLLRRVAPELEFDPRVRMELCEACHLNHHAGQANRKIALEKIPEAAIAFAVDVLGEDQAAFYLRRFYRTEAA